MNIQPSVQSTEANEFSIIKEPAQVTLVMDINSYAHFVTLVRRGVNTWDTAPTEIKQLADIVLDIPVTTKK